MTPRDGAAWNPGRPETAGLVIIVVLFTILAAVVAITNPPWEANDEKDHYHNAGPCNNISILC